jgi:hypothetical protein
VSDTTERVSDEQLLALSLGNFSPPAPPDGEAGVDRTVTTELVTKLAAELVSLRAWIERDTVVQAVERLREWFDRYGELERAKAERDAARAEVVQRDAMLRRAADAIGAMMGDGSLGTRRLTPVEQAGIKYHVVVIDTSGMSDLQSMHDDIRAAQKWFDANRSDPFPKCWCGEPSHIYGAEGGGACCDAHVLKPGAPPAAPSPEGT